MVPPTPHVLSISDWFPVFYLGNSNVPLGLITGGFEVTVSTLTWPVLLPEAICSASATETFWIMADFASPVPASRLPAFCAKKTSSVAGILKAQSVVVESADVPLDERNGLLPDDSFVKQGVLFRLCNYGQFWLMTNNVEEIGIIDEKRAVFQPLSRGARRHPNLTSQISMRAVSCSSITARRTYSPAIIFTRGRNRGH